MKTVAIMPIKLNNERLPGKNLRRLGDKPLLQYELINLLSTGLTESVNVYCSDTSVCAYLPKGVRFIRRPKSLDLPTSNFSQIFESFMNVMDADIYVYAHATAPFVTAETMRSCISAVQSGAYDSSFCAVKIQDYLWQDGRPLNFDAENLPRSQDLTPIYRETSGIYVFTKQVFQQLHRRIGSNPFIKEVSCREAVDINTQEDFDLAAALIEYNNGAVCSTPQFVQSIREII